VSSKPWGCRLSMALSINSTPTIVKSQTTNTLTAFLRLTSCSNRASSGPAISSTELAMELKPLASFRRETIDSEPYDEDSGHTSPLHL
jgi:hypothetical protein